MGLPLLLLFQIALLVQITSAQTSEEVPLPEYYGIYAVVDGDLVKLDSQQVPVKKTASIKLGRRNAVGNILRGEPVASSAVREVHSFSADLKIIVFAQTSGLASPQVIAESLHLEELVFVRNVLVDTGFPENVRRSGTENGWESGEAPELLGFARGDRPKALEFLVKPLAGQRDMVVAGLSEKLKPGVYRLSLGQRDPLFGASGFLFAVQPVSEGETAKCVDVSVKYAMMMADTKYTPCSASAVSAGPSQPSSEPPVSSPPSSVAALCSDAATCLENANSFLVSSQYQQAAAMWDRALQLGGPVSFAVCHERTLSCVRGTFSLSQDQISFVDARGQKVLTGQPSEATPVEVRKVSVADSAYFRLRLANRNYNFHYIPEGMQCKVGPWAECPNPGLQQQLSVGSWVIQAIPKLASGAFTPSQPLADVARQPVVPGGTIGQFRHGTLVTKLPSGSLLAAPTPQDATHTHPGVDMVAECQTPIYVVADGTVVDTVASDKGTNFDSLGHMVIVKHSQPVGGKDTFSAYFHMSQPPAVQTNDKVIAGQTQIEVVGKTGVATGCHLHLEVRHFGSRFLENPEWSQASNIYGIGDQTKSTVFLNNWENPEQLGLKLQ